MRKTVDVLVVGAGPAGLGVGAALTNEGADVLVIDRGRELGARRHDAAEDLGEGIGGAGLFSDGKFSFYPSGTQLYSLTDEDRLRRAYQWCCDQLGDVGIGTVDYPSDREQQFIYRGDIVKDYPSYYGSLDARRILISNMTAALRNQIWTLTTLTALSAGPDGYEVELMRRGEPGKIGARSIVLATGRLGSLEPQLAHSGLIPTVPIRYEFGIRIEARHEATFLARHKAPDVKRLQEINGLEFRTFCTCRRGEVWHIKYGTYSALSGRSDGPKTGYSNFGFLVRFVGPKLAEGRSAWSVIRERSQGDNALYQPLGAFLREDWPEDLRLDQRPWNPSASFVRGDVGEALGDGLSNAMRHGIRELLSWAPELQDPSTVCLFPAIEGVGEFPACDRDLRIPGQRIWCAGDLVGTMRGLVPSIVNGYYVGLGVASA